ncbi:MAG: hypothetical protein QOG83_3748 [Alphaproteobacteria bacterium]|jgi:hypothetical protein|nr:hypothetical protein [Alphaproteobacteria bacterium]
MLRHPLPLAALGVLAAAAMAGQAAAGSCCACAMPCAAPAPVVQVAPAPPMYIVNQGPSYYGPGVVVSPFYFPPETMPALNPYPYVSRDYYVPYFDDRYYVAPRRHRYHPRVVKRSHREEVQNDEPEHPRYKQKPLPDPGYK